MSKIDHPSFRRLDIVHKPNDRIFSFFVPTYQYRVCKGQSVDGKVLSEKLWNSTGVVYARTYRKEVVYIGKTDGPLKRRVKDHLQRITRYTKQKDIDYREWAEGKTVTIYAYQPEKAYRLGLPVPTHVGLEHTLIDEIKPKFVSRK